MFKSFLGGLLVRQNSIAVLVVVGLGLSACVADLPDTHPTGTEAPPAPVVIQIPAAPTASPFNPTAAPANPSSPAPAPASPNPPASANGCGLGRGPGDGEGCPRTSPAFLDDMDRAAARVAASRGDLFRGGRVPVENWNAYYAAMIQELQGMGYCAMFDGHDIAVKNTNSFNEQYHVIASNGAPRTGEGSYRATCRPAWF